MYSCRSSKAYGRKGFRALGVGRDMSDFPCDTAADGTWIGG
jgi:hypothetical protein